jgi:hypothetical protein
VDKTHRPASGQPGGPMSRKRRIPLLFISAYFFSSMSGWLEVEDDHFVAAGAGAIVVA